MDSLLDSVARELQVHTEIIAAAAVRISTKCSSPRNALAGAKNAAQFPVVLVENSIVIVMLVEDHIRLQSKLYSGKTTLTLYMIAVAQTLEENPDKEEIAFELTDSLCQSGAIHQICVNFVLALTPRAEIGGEHWMQQMDLQIQLFLRLLSEESESYSLAKEQELALAKAVDAMTQSLESSITSESKREKQHEYDDDRH
ncbi:hypothetical protein Nepgr_013743 [Nepenthes gracilis]|uniref:RecA-like N-terminal domain-containing protein n=1 Tax=Nepenthes gracilis TaxID=150966 RepID=A0AAD3SIX3_NEPGR|nr:hypothetical protein Nepgr_013743 [Nepenthes gracilis]